MPVGASSPAPRPGPAEQPAWVEEVLGLVGLMGPEPVPVWLLAEQRERLSEEAAAVFSDPTKRAGCAEELEAEGLLQVVGERWALPAETRNSYLERLSGEERRERCAQALEIIRSAFPPEPDEHGVWSSCEELLPHLLAVGDRAEELGIKGASFAWLLDHAAVYLFSKGEFSKALELSTRALAGSNLAPDDPVLGEVRHTHGRLLSEHGEVNEARLELERALQVHLAAGDDLPARKDRVSLAEVLLESGEPKEAMSQIDQALAGRDPEQADRCDCAAHRMRAWILWSQNELEQAETAYAEAVELTEKVLGPLHQDTVNGLTGLGGVRGSRGQLKEARADLERALETLEGTVDEQHPEIAVVRSNLGGVLHSLGEFEGAREQLEKALEAGEELLPSDHKGLWIRHNKLASILRTLNQYKAARAHAEAALEISERSPEIAEVKVEADLQMLAAILKELGERSEARGAYARARKIAAEERGSDHRDVAAYDFRLGEVSRELGDLAASRAYFERCLRAYEAIPDPANALAVRLELAVLLARLGDETAKTTVLLGRTEEARELATATESIFRQALEAELQQAEGTDLTRVAEAATARAPDLTAAALVKAVEGVTPGEVTDADLRSKVGLAWQRLGRARLGVDPQAAKAAFEAALPFFPDSLLFQGVLLHDLATASSALRETEDAIRLFREAADRKRDAAEKGKPRELALTLYALGQALAGANRLEEAREAFAEQIQALRSLPDPEADLEARALHAMGDAARRMGDAEEAIEFYRRALDLRRSIRDSIHPNSFGVTLVWLGRTLSALGRYEEATSCFQEWLDTLQELGQPDPQAEGVALHDLANVLQAEGDKAGAIELLREAVERKRLGDDRRDLALTVHALGRGLKRDDPEAALSALGETLQVLGSLERPDPGFEGTVLHDIADVHKDRGDLAKALELYREAIARKEQRKRPSSRDLLSLSASQQALGRTLLDAGDPKAAASAFQDQLRTVREFPEVDRQAEGVALHDLADVRLEMADTEEAVTLYQQALSCKQGAETVNESSVATTQQALARALERGKHYESALDAYETLRGQIRELQEPDIEFEAITLRDLADVRRELGESELAAELYRESTELSERSGNSRGRALGLQGLGAIHEQKKEYRSALETYQEALDLLRSLPERAPEEAYLLCDLGDAHHALGEVEKAIDRYREAVGILDQGDAGSEEMAAALLAQGSAELDGGRGSGAAAALKRAVELIKSEPKVEPILLYGAVSKLGTAMEGDDPERAIEYLLEARDILDASRPTEYLERAAVETLLFKAYAAVGEEEKAVAAREAAISILKKGIAAGLLLSSDSLSTFHRFAIDKDHLALADVVLQAVRDQVAEEKSVARLGRTLVNLLGTQARRLEDEGDLEAALADYVERVDLIEKLSAGDPQLQGAALEDLANLHLAQGRLAEAAAAGAEALELLRSAEEPASHLLAAALALAALEVEDDEARLGMLLEAEELMGDPPSVYRLEPHWLLDQLARLYEQMGKEEEAKAADLRAAALKK